MSNMILHVRSQHLALTGIRVQVLVRIEYQRDRFLSLEAVAILWRISLSLKLIKHVLATAEVMMTESNAVGFFAVKGLSY